MNRSAATGSALAFVAGYVDTACFIVLFGLFTAHVTGNFVLIGSELVHPVNGVTIKFLAFPAFIAAVAVSRLIAQAAERGGRSAARPLLRLQIVLLAACMLCGWYAQPIVDATAPWVLLTGMLGAAAMGVQNASARLAFADLSPTTMMTGNVTQLVIGIVDLLRGSEDPGLADRIRKFAWPVLTFACGAISGALICERLSLGALCLPLAILSVLALASPVRH
jgi:uncharacterized membrane protein YoaK (UPF0700 family)